MKHVRSTPEQRTQAALYSLGTLALDQRRRFVEHLEERCPVCRAEVASFEAVVDDIALAAAPVPPRRELRAALLARAAAEVTPMPLPPFHFVLEGEGAWTEVEPRVFRKDLAVFPGSGPSVFLIRIEPGAHAATHRHRGVEDCYVISGDLHVAGRHIHAGDHHRAAAGTTHEGIRTDGGCLLLIVDAAA